MHLSSCKYDLKILKLPDDNLCQTDTMEHYLMNFGKSKEFCKMLLNGWGFVSMLTHISEYQQIKGRYRHL